jgi:hypothetical protein
VVGIGPAIERFWGTSNGDTFVTTVGVSACLSRHEVFDATITSLASSGVDCLRVVSITSARDNTKRCDSADRRRHGVRGTAAAKYGASTVGV